MFVVTCPVRDDRLALVLETVGRFDGFRRVNSPVVADAVESLYTRLYGKPVSLRPGELYFAEDN